MSNDPQESSGEPISAEQRLELLEKGRRLDRILLFILAAVLLMTLASSLTMGLLSPSGEQDASLVTSKLQGLQEQTAALQTQIAELELKLSQQGNQLSTLQNGKPAAPLTSGDNRALLQQVAKTLTGQEQSFQKSLAALKNGMRDLAGMIAGSRSWLSDYQEALDKQLAESQARMQQLQQWASDSSGSPAATAAP
jgi:chromosome segregation ATPase